MAGKCLFPGLIFGDSGDKGRVGEGRCLPGAVVVDLAGGEARVGNYLEEN